MAERGTTSGRLSREQTEEIVEKKPTAPMAVALLILSTIFIILAICLEVDWLNLYYRSVDYEEEPAKEPADYYNDVIKDLALTKEMLKVPGQK